MGHALVEFLLDLELADREKTSVAIEEAQSRLLTVAEKLDHDDVNSCRILAYEFLDYCLDGPFLVIEAL
jgi:hypothetical protein